MCVIPWTESLGTLARTTRCQSCYTDDINIVYASSLGHDTDSRFVLYIKYSIYIYKYLQSKYDIQSVYVTSSVWSTEKKNNFNILFRVS